ncbi:hypothetical protein [Enterococcus gallinarum]|uniref:hypothetical protein n=1 Tax=Enterococcus gallinarum TaxID=1353 RepID=UPI001E34DB44|nr:hypothetical protein [Enterococcus gallinarum]
MLVTTDNVIAAWLSPSRQLSIRVKMNDVTYGSEDITSLSFDSGSISGETYQIGSTYMNSIQIIFPSLIETVKEDMELLPELGVLVNGTYEYTKLGHFFIDEFERNRNNNTTTIKATDKMRFMEGPYESKLSYPRAYKEVALEIANLSGVEVNQNSFASLGIGAINKPVEYTFRQAIGLIAQFEGGFASFNRNGELEIRRLAPTTFEINPESYMLKGFTKNEVSYRIGGISVKTGEEETDVIRVGSTNGSQVQLENRVMTQQLLNQTWELVKDLNYFPYELKWRGCPPLEAGDWIYVTANDGTKYSVPNLSYSITFNGGMSAESKATTSSSSQATYKYRGPLNQRIDYLDSILSSNNWNTNYYDQTEPSNPKEGDIWFKPNGQDTEIWVYKNIDGVLKWIMEISSAGDPDLLQAIEDAKKAGQDAQLAAEEAKNAAADAKQAGEEAQKVGEDAKSAAENAKSAADDAKAVGENAQLAANDAKLAGDTAIALANQADIDAKAAKAKADAIQIDVNSLVSDVATINGNVTTISSKANEAYSKAQAVEGKTVSIENTVNGFTGRLADIETVSDTTTKKVNELEVTVDGQKQTLATVQTTANSALSKSNTLSTDVDSMKITLTSVKDWQNDFQVGGRNLLRDSELPDRSTISSNDSDRYPITKTVMTEGSRNFIRIKRYNPTLNNTVISLFSGIAFTSLTESIINNGPITVSFAARAQKPSRWSFMAYYFFPQTDAPNKKDLEIGTTWKRYSITFNSIPEGATAFRVNPQQVVMNSDIDMSTFYLDICEYKVERGSIATDWDPAPEDKAQTSKVNQIESTVNGTVQTVASVKTTADSALTKATQVETTANGLKTTISSVETTANNALTKATQVEATASGIRQTVTEVQTDLNNLDINDRNLFVNSTQNLKSITINGWNHYPNGTTYKIPVTEGEIYTVRAYITDVSTTGTGVGVKLFWYNSAGTIIRESPNPKEGWIPNGGSGYFTLTDNAPGDAVAVTVAIRNSNYLDSTLKYKELKLQKGNKATLWTPAPEDMATSSQFTQLSDQINFKVSKGDVINQINVSTESILISGNKVRITGQTTIDNGVIKNAQIADLAVSNGKIANLAVTEGKIGNLAVANAKIASLAVTEGKIGDAAITNAKIGNLAVSEAKIADLAVSSAKIANLAVTETKIGDAAITNAKIGNLEVSTAKIADGAIVNAKIGDAAITNAKIADASISSAKIISLDAGKIVASSLAAITTETGTLNVTGWLTMSTENKGMMGTYDFGDGYAAAFNYRWFVGDWRLSHRHLVFTGKIYNVTSSNTRGSYLYDAESFYGNDYLKMRQYNSSGKLLNRIDINSDAITMSDEDWGGRSKSVIRSDGTGNFFGRVTFNAGADIAAPDNVGLRVGRIDAPLNYDTISINAERAGLTDVSFGTANIFFNSGKASSADLRIGLDGVGPIFSSMAIYNRTYSLSANMFVTNSGAIGRATSASKYKLNITEVNNIVELGEKLLTINPKYWFDRTNIELASKGMTEGGLNDVDPITLRPHYGLIAEDLRGAGLDAFISTNYDTGEIEGIEYDRLWVILIPLVRKLVENNVLQEVRMNKLERLMGELVNG